MNNNFIKGNTPYKATITREHFLFYEMRTTSKLLSDKIDNEEVIRQITTKNLFQYPTDKSTRRMAKLCIDRLNALNNTTLIWLMANAPVKTSKQVCLYAMMKHSRLTWEFMLTVIAEKYRVKDFTLDKSDFNIFFLRLQEQDDVVASWSDSTITKLKQVLKKALIETSYLDNAHSGILNPILIDKTLKNTVISTKDKVVLPAFNCFEQEKDLWII